MMHVLDKPTMQYVVEEAIEAGVDECFIITGRGKQSIGHHFDMSYELEVWTRERITLYVRHRSRVLRIRSRLITTNRHL